MGLETRDGLHARFQVLLSDFDQNWLVLQILMKFCNIKFHENQVASPSVDVDRQTCCEVSPSASYNVLDLLFLRNRPHNLDDFMLGNRLVCVTHLVPVQQT
jgi:hypothetical protein